VSKEFSYNRIISRENWILKAGWCIIERINPLGKVTSMYVQVDCYAGYRGEETPRRIYFGQRLVVVRDIIDRWLAPDHRYFKCLGNDNGIYIIRHDIETWTWELTFFDGQNRSAVDLSTANGKGILSDASDITAKKEV
jgi:hypothetical protein